MSTQSVTRAALDTRGRACLQLGMVDNRIARLTITLDAVKPPVRRRLEVPLDIRLDQLHLVFQAAMGWTGGHLYEIRVKDEGWGKVDPDWDEGPRDARKARLGAVLAAAGAKTFKYIYDFGDDWRHSVKVERIGDAAPGLSYPRLIDGAGRCPPEDVGGAWGYAELLEAVADPAHERHDEFIEWVGAIDPAAFDRDTHAGAVDALAQGWSRRGKSKPA